MLIAVLAILKAGGAYVPMDPTYPQERIKYILKDTKAKVVLTTDKHLVRVKGAKTKKTSVICLDDAGFQEIVRKCSTVNPVSQTMPFHLCYVIYTSGTTGNPKGVMLEHRGVVNRIVWMNDEYPLTENDRILQKTPYVFDVSVWELFWANWYGAAIVFAKPDGQKDNAYMAQLINEKAVTVIHFVPSMLSVFEEALEYNEELQDQVRGLKYLFCSGEALTLTQVKKAHRLMPNTEIHNLYGPTEASVDVLYYDCNDRDITSVLIGKPIANTSMYILDEYRKPVPVGTIGELYIGGDNVARGYLNLPDLTRERFIPNPFQSDRELVNGKNTRLYKTGDLTRYLPDGNIEYLGRNDFQVKIRGFRIELGEIENSLALYPGVRHAVVLAREKGEDKYLAGYYVSPEPIDHSLILAYLSENLPEYMVPAALVHLENLPLTINGKLDRKALPEPEFGKNENRKAPENAIQEELCTIYAEVLGMEPSAIGIDDDFFLFGGNSISAIRLAAKIKKAFGTTVSIVTLFECKTIRHLSEHLDSVWKGEFITPENVDEPQEILTPEDYEKIVYKWNETECPYPSEKTLHRLIEEQAAKWPHKFAVSCNETELTYRELNEKANRLATYLRNTYDIHPDDAIGLCVARNEHLLVAMLAILKAGAAYVPIDPELPQERIRHMFADSAPKLVLSSLQYKWELEKLSGPDLTIEYMDDPALNILLSAFSAGNPVHETEAGNLAYILYTSGTTGAPKGALLTHRGIVNFVHAMQADLEIGAADRQLAATTISFDVSVIELITPLASGAQVVLADSSAIKDPVQLLDMMRKKGITIMAATPSRWRTILEAGWNEPLPIHVLCGGEALTEDLVSRMLPLCRSIRNQYGPTETSICATSKLIASADDKITIGRPLQNVKTYILDSELNPVPVGTTGEMYIGGNGLARGYLNLPELTRERFIPNPFRTQQEIRAGRNAYLYKTGDLAKYLENGEIDFIGRNDFQVKINGHRIETGEIEARMQEHREIKQAVVIPKAGKGMTEFLAGYYVSEVPIKEGEILSLLRTYLPEYMLPKNLVHLLEIPLTRNGKIDRDALPEPAFTGREKYLAPQTITQEGLRVVFAEVLGLAHKSIGINDDFFHLGGTSMLAVRLLTQVNRHFNSELTIADIFVERTVRRLAAKLKHPQQERSLIVKLNENTGAENLFMIHPGNAGCEVYVPLARRLQGEFSCYGVDSYNLYHDDMISTLPAMAAEYLAQIDNVQKETGRNSYTLIGWSLGGQIALEIAAILENRGIKNIRVYLLDTILSDDELKALDNEMMEERMSLVAKQVGAILKTAEKCQRYMLSQIAIWSQAISDKLQHTKVTLFKATEPDTVLQSEGGKRGKIHILNLKANNIEQCLAAADKQLEVIGVTDADHYSMLKDEELLCGKLTEARR
jgi:amino acid adenylation domain-containing protein